MPWGTTGIRTNIKDVKGGVVLPHPHFELPVWTVLKSEGSERLRLGFLSLDEEVTLTTAAVLNIASLPETH